MRSPTSCRSAISCTPVSTRKRAWRHEREFRRAAPLPGHASVCLPLFRAGDAVASAASSDAASLGLSGQRRLSGHDFAGADRRCDGIDPFGNPVTEIAIETAHSELDIVAGGVVEVLAYKPPDVKSGQAWNEVKTSSPIARGGNPAPQCWRPRSSFSNRPCPCQTGLARVRERLF